MIESNSSPEPANWERQALERLARGALDEQRRARRWGIFFKLVGFGYLIVVLVIASGWMGGRDSKRPGRHTALVEVHGVIQAQGEASADRVNQALKDAFEDEKTVGVVMRINSPGGSPVQAGQINSEIKRLRGLHPNVPLYAVVDDICASGGYYVAAAADKIFVDQASIVGSIGVLMDGFGFTGTMEKLGVERRLITAGENKGFLDPFSAINPSHKAYAEQLLKEIHSQFVQVVRQGRGQRLKESPELFSGLVWSGRQSIAMGLADSMGSLDSVARDVIKAEHVVDFTTRENFAERVARRFGAAVSQALLQSLGSGPAVR
ncbi:MAG: S49 family peptidase [Betaproteobacteria bacterium]|nr:S49 family peptidase [Betaproteobacteria bacterium]